MTYDWEADSEDSWRFAVDRKREEMLGGVFRPHVAGLAKADKVIAPVGFFGAIEKAERLDVMHWQAITNVLAAVAATSALFLDHLCSREHPASAAICARPANPIGRVWAARFGSASAGYSAISGWSVLLFKPRLLTKLRPAVFANPERAILPLMVGRSAHLFGCKCVSRSFPESKFVADQMRFGGCVQECIGLPTRTAGSRTKPRLVFPVWLHRKSRAATLAIFFNHVSIIADRAFMGKRTTLVPAPPKQEAMDL